MDFTTWLNFKYPISFETEKNYTEKKWKEKNINEFIPQFYRYTILGEKMDVNFSFTVSEVRFQPYA